MPYEATWLCDKEGKVIAPKTLVNELENDIEHPEEAPDIAGTKITFESEDTKEATEYTDVDLMISGETNAELFTKISMSVKNIRYLFAILSSLIDEEGNILPSKLPSFVEEIINGTLETFPRPGEIGKLYVDTKTNLTYRWSGIEYVPVNSSLALGETNATAYRGDRGKIAYDHSQAAHAPTTVATELANGLMSTDHVLKLKGIEEGANKYIHPSTSGNKHIPSGGSSGQILRWSSDGTAVWSKENNTEYVPFVKSGSGAKSGLVPAPPSTAGTTKYLREDGTWQVPPDEDHTYNLGSFGINTSAAEINHLKGIKSNVQTQLDAKAPSNHGRHVPDYCEIITNWNNAITNGWFMASNATNAPTTGWFFGRVIAHNASYVVQEVWQFTASTNARIIPKYTRALMNGTWGSWGDITESKVVLPVNPSAAEISTMAVGSIYLTT